MQLAIEIATWSIVAFGIILFAIQLAMYEVGYRLGGWQREQGTGQVEGVGIVVGGMLALLAFVLALTLGFSSSRFNERRVGTLAEANAIGTAWLRAEAIGHPRGSEIARLLKDYTRVREDFVRADQNTVLINELNQRTGTLQSVIWGHLAAIVRENPNDVTSSLMEALNNVFDMSAAERFAFNQRLPPQIFWLLIGMALLSIAAVGYQMSLRGRPVRILVASLIGMWTLVIVNILDIAAARIGSFDTSVAVYDWTLQSFEGQVSIPPLSTQR